MFVANSANTFTVTPVFCLLCNNEQFKKVHDHADGHGLWRCSSCGLLQTSPMPSASELSAYYQKYDVLGEREPYYQAMWGADALKTPEGVGVHERFNWAKKHCKNFGKTLDVGSGPGLFLRLVKENGGVAQGVEINEKAAQRSSAQLGVPVVVGTLSDVTENDFNTITLWDLLEHVSNPKALVLEAHRRLRPNGWLFIETPNEGALLDWLVRLLSTLGLKGPALTFYGLHHLVLFRPATISRLLKENGFNVVEVAGAETEVSRIFRGNGFKDKITRLVLGVLFLLARLIGKQNKMLIAAIKR